MAWLGATILATLCRSSAAEATAAILEAEETYELRIERVLQTKGKQALVQFLAQELKERPRPYVKAWYANYLLYGAEFGLKEVVDPPRGFALAKESADEGSLFGQDLVGRALGDGRGTVRDVPEALRYLRVAAERGRGSAMAELGKYYFFGAGVPVDRIAAEHWMRDAVHRRAYAGMLYLAGWWENPQYVGSPDSAKANSLLYEAAYFGSAQGRNKLRERAKKGDADAQRYIDLLFVMDALEGSNPLTTQLQIRVANLRKAAAPDDARVQLAIARVMLVRTWPLYDSRTAKATLARLSAAGNDEARNVQGWVMWAGIDEKANPGAAVALWRELAQKDQPDALARMGWLHWWGNAEAFGVSKDPALTFEFSRRAADLGQPFAQLNTAECYAHGIGVPVNYALAGKYYGIAEDRGYIKARRLKERVLALVKD